MNCRRNRILDSIIEAHTTQLDRDVSILRNTWDDIYKQQLIESIEEQMRRIRRIKRLKRK